MKEKAKDSRKARGRLLRQAAAGVRWTVTSWLRPAARAASWEQDRGRNCAGEKGER